MHALEDCMRSGSQDGSIHAQLRQTLAVLVTGYFKDLSEKGQPPSRKEQWSTCVFACDVSWRVHQHAGKKNVARPLISTPESDNCCSPLVLGVGTLFEDLSAGRMAET